MPRAKKQKTETNNDMGSQAHAWSDLPSQLNTAIEKVNQVAPKDPQLKAFTTSNAIDRSATFGIKSAESDSVVLITVSNGNAQLRTGSSKDAEFTLAALPEQWQEFFKQTPVMPYQSYWGKSWLDYGFWFDWLTNRSRNVWHGMNRSPFGRNARILTFCRTSSRRGSP